ncbi:GNAT family N-acetyltransferase [Streptomyces sp. NPDC051001]|uniref:GNAT family N-acetyltransferase n=1 Tax=Streptomyces sp. NPDC051001 TaxID=3155795 RepID=UPI003414BA9E
MSDVRIEPALSDAMLEQWRYVHNVIIPADELDLATVRERAARYRLENAYVGDELVGCSTVRPPEGGAATVIARVLPEHRRQGFGTALYENGLAHARVLGATTIETCVLAVNEDGLRFAEKHGFTEVERYVLPPETDLWVDLRLDRAP